MLLKKHDKVTGLQLLSKWMPEVDRSNFLVSTRVDELGNEIGTIAWLERSSQLSQKKYIAASYARARIVTVLYTSCEFLKQLQIRSITQRWGSASYSAWLSLGLKFDSLSLVLTPSSLLITVVGSFVTKVSQYSAFVQGFECGTYGYSSHPC